MLKQLVSLVLLASSLPVLANDAPTGAAQSSFEKIQALIKSSVENSSATLSLGTGLPVWRITTASVQAYQTSGTESDLYESPVAYLFPIASGTDTVLYLRMEKDADGDWQSQGFGYAQLASELVEVRAAWPVSEGNQVFLVENTVTREMLFGLENVENANLTPFRFFEHANLDAEGNPILKYQTLGNPSDVATQTLQFVSGGDQ